MDRPMKTIAVKFPATSAGRWDAAIKGLQSPWTSADIESQPRPLSGFNRRH